MAKVLADELENYTDQQLVIKAKTGDEGCFWQLYKRYHPRVRSTLYQLCGNSLLDDLVQDVFLKAWKGLPKLREPSYFGTWLYRISWNVATDQRRRWAQNQQAHLNPLLVESSAANSPDWSRLHYQDLIWRGLQALNLEQRAVLTLHDLQDLPQKDVARILGIPVGTVKSRLFHARQSIRVFLEAQGVEL